MLSLQCDDVEWKNLRNTTTLARSTDGNNHDDGDGDDDDGEGATTSAQRTAALLCVTCATEV